MSTQSLSFWFHVLSSSMIDGLDPRRPKPFLDSKSRATRNREDTGGGEGEAGQAGGVGFKPKPAPPPVGGLFGSLADTPGPAVCLGGRESAAATRSTVTV